MRTRTAFIAAAIAAASAALAADTIMRPGRWEMTAQMDFGGRELPPGIPLSKPMTSIACITEEEAKQVTTPIQMPDKSCKMSDYKQNGMNISYTVRCDEMTMWFKATLHSPDSYSGTSTSHGKEPSQKMTMKFSGMRAGDKCSAKELAEDAEE